MILDEVQNAARYHALHPLFAEAFAFLARTPLASLESGRHELRGDQMFALINRDPGRGRQGARLEAHRRYIDIQLLVEGREEIGWRALRQCRQLTDPNDESLDIMFFCDPPDTWIDLPPGKLMIFYPEDAHAPLAACGENTKAVIKVAV
jgi:biofilm protein TabA